MTNDIETLRLWIFAVQCVAGVSATLFPILYAFSPWYASWLGRLLMFQGVAFAMALDVSLVFQLMRINKDSIMLRFWVYALVLTLIAVATSALTIMMVRMNYRKFKRKKAFTVTDVTPMDLPVEGAKTHPLLSNTSYDKLKPITTLLMPAVVTFVLGVGEIWNLDWTPQVGATLGAFNVLLGVILAVATRSYNNSDEKFDGTVDVQHIEGTKTVVMDIKTEPEDMLNQKQVTLKVNNP